MGMSTHCMGFKPPDATWRKMKKIYDACNEADIGIPPTVSDYFNNEEPDEAGVVVDIDAAVSEYNANETNGYEIDIAKLPKDVKIIRVYNSY